MVLLLLTAALPPVADGLEARAWIAEYDVIDHGLLDKALASSESERSKPNFGRPRLQPLQGPADALLHRHLWLPAKSHPSFADVWAAPGRVIFGKRTIYHRREGIRDPQYELCEISDSELFGISKINWPRFCRINHLEDSSDQVINITETTCLSAVAINSYGVAVERMRDEVSHNATIGRAHAGTICVEDPDDTDI